MAVHMVRVLCEPPKGEAENAISNWVDNYNEWTADPVEHSLTEMSTNPYGDGGTAFVRGDWRFIQNGENPTNILTDLSDPLKSLQGGLWHRLGYHVCDHDEDQPIRDCLFSETVEYGTVPSRVSL